MLLALGFLPRQYSPRAEREVDPPRVLAATGAYNERRRRIAAATRRGRRRGWASKRPRRGARGDLSLTGASTLHAPKLTLRNHRLAFRKAASGEEPLVGRYLMRPADAPRCAATKRGKYAVRSAVVRVARRMKSRDQRTMCNRAIEAASSHASESNKRMNSSAIVAGKAAREGGFRHAQAQLGWRLGNATSIGSRG